MPILDVAFTDSTQSTIAAVFASPQPVTVWPNQAAINTATSEPYATWWDALPTAVQALWPSPTAS